MQLVGPPLELLALDAARSAAALLEELLALLELLALEELLALLELLDALLALDGAAGVDVTALRRRPPRRCPPCPPRRAPAPAHAPGPARARSAGRGAAPPVPVVLLFELVMPIHPLLDDELELEALVGPDVAAAAQPPA